MTGDDYTHYFPPVQQAVNEWVLRQPPGSFVPPQEFAGEWGRLQRMRRVRILTPGDENNDSAPLAPFLLRLPGQWVLRKQLPGVALHSMDPASLAKRKRRFGSLGAPQRCCLNGWADPDLSGMCSLGKVGKAGRQACEQRSKAGGPYYTRCNPDGQPLQQSTCALPANRTYCIAVFACHTSSAHGGRAGGGGTNG